jgi:hypothetical protein
VSRAWRAHDAGEQKRRRRIWRARACMHGSGAEAVAQHEPRGWLGQLRWWRQPELRRTSDSKAGNKSRWTTVRSHGAGWLNEPRGCERHDGMG